MPKINRKVKQLQEPTKMAAVETPDGEVKIAPVGTDPLSKDGWVTLGHVSEDTLGLKFNTSGQKHFDDSLEHLRNRFFASQLGGNDDYLRERSLRETDDQLRKYGLIAGEPAVQAPSGLRRPPTALLPDLVDLVQFDRALKHFLRCGGAVDYKYSIVLISSPPDASTTGVRKWQFVYEQEGANLYRSMIEKFIDYTGSSDEYSRAGAMREVTRQISLLTQEVIAPKPPLGIKLPPITSIADIL